MNDRRTMNPGVPAEPQQQYDNNMRGVLFDNENKRGPKSPAMTGKETITCPHCQKMTDFRLASWWQKSRKGDDYMSISVTYEPPEEETPPF
jgi:hypothetical protein